VLLYPGQLGLRHNITYLMTRFAGTTVGRRGYLSEISIWAIQAHLTSVSTLYDDTILATWFQAQRLCLLFGYLFGVYECWGRRESGCRWEAQTHEKRVCLW
jgi:hypothetical protein